MRLGPLKETSSPIHLLWLSELSLVPFEILSSHTHNDTITPVPSLLIPITTPLPLPSHTTEAIYQLLGVTPESRPKKCMLSGCASSVGSAMDFKLRPLSLFRDSLPLFHPHHSIGLGSGRRREAYGVVPLTRCASVKSAGVDAGLTSLNELFLTKCIYRPAAAAEYPFSWQT